MISHVTLAWPEFAAAAFLLLVPLPLLFGRGVGLRELDRSWEHLWMRAVSLPWHWIDLLRVSAGVWLLKAAIGLNQHREVLTDDPVNAVTGHAELVVAAGLLLLGMVVQTVSCRAEGAFFIPFVYVLAATAVWFPPLLATLTLVSAVASAAACRSLSSFLWWQPVGLGVLGYWLDPDWLMVAIGMMLSLGGALLPILFQREFVFAHRALPVDPELSRPLR